MTTGDLTDDDKIKEGYESLKGYFGENKVSLKEFERFIKFKGFFENKPVPEDERRKKNLLLSALILVLQEENAMNYKIPVGDAFLEGIPVDETLIERIPVETLAEPIPIETFAFAEKIPLGHFLLILGIIAAFIVGFVLYRRKILDQEYTTELVPQEDTPKPSILLIAIEKEKLEKFQSLDNGNITITDENKGDFLKIPRYLLTEPSEKDIEEIKGKKDQGDFIVLSIEPKDKSAFKVDAPLYTQKAGFNSLVGSSLTILGQADRNLLRGKDFRQAKV